MQCIVHFNSICNAENLEKKTKDTGDSDKRQDQLCSPFAPNLLTNISSKSENAKIAKHMSMATIKATICEHVSR